MDKVTGQCPQTTTFLKRKENRSLTARPNRLTRIITIITQPDISYFLWRAGVSLLVDTGAQVTGVTGFTILVTQPLHRGLA